jgi:hypothetical protein
MRLGSKKPDESDTLNEKISFMTEHYQLKRAIFKYVSILYKQRGGRVITRESTWDTDPFVVTGVKGSMIEAICVHPMRHSIARNSSFFSMVGARGCSERSLTWHTAALDRDTRFSKDAREQRQRGRGEDTLFFTSFSFFAFFHDCRK